MCHIRSAVAAWLIYGSLTVHAQGDPWTQRIAAAKQAITEARYDDAFAWAKDALTLLDTNNQAAAPRYAETLNVQAVVRHSQCNYADAERLFQQSSSIWRMLKTPSAEDSLAITLSNLGQAQMELGKYPQAEQAFHDALQFRGPPDRFPDRETLTALLGMARQFQGSTKDADALTAEAVAMARDRPAILPDQLAIVLNARSRVLLIQGRLEEAIPSAREVFELTVKQHGLDHSLTANAMVHLSEIYIALSQPELAEPLLRKALATIERTFGTGSPPSSQILRDIGCLHIANSRYTLAASILHRALAIEEGAYGSSSARLVPILNRLASAHVFAGNYEEALPILSRSVDVAQNVPALRGELGAAFRYRAYAESKLGRLPTAKQDYHHAIELLESVYGPNDDGLLATLQDFATFLRKTRQPEVKEVNRRIKIIQTARELQSRNGH